MDDISINSSTSNTVSNKTSSSTTISSNCSEERSKPKNVASHLWEKFKLLEERTNEVTKRSTEKRIKHIQHNILNSVSKEFANEEETDILRKHNVQLPENTSKDIKPRKRKSSETAADKSEDCQSGTGPIETLQPYMNLNSHLITTDHSRPAPPTALEQKINTAIQKGDVSTAEQLSNQLAERIAAEKIVSAIDSKRFLEKQEEEKEKAKNKKKRKLLWGFQHKERWEMKGNM